MTEHTPGPWRAERNTIYSDIVGRGPVATIHGDKRYPDDARFIVTACNCHAELLEACRTTFDYLCDAYEDSEAFKISQVLEQAIRNAEEQMR